MIEQERTISRLRQRLTPSIRFEASLDEIAKGSPINGTPKAIQTETLGLYFFKRF